MTAGFDLTETVYISRKKQICAGKSSSYSLYNCFIVFTRGGVEDTRLEAKAKDTKKIRGQGQGQPFRGQTLSRPRAGMLEAKDRNARGQGQGPRTQPQVFSERKKRSLKKFLRQSPIYRRSQNF